MLISPAQAKPTAAPLSPNAPVSPAAVDTRAVLLVEAEPAVARMLTRLFGLAGLRVLAAVDVTEGLRLLERNSRDIALAFFDCHGTADDCREICGRVRSILPALPLVLAGSGDLPTGAAANPDGDRTVFVARPYLPTEVVWKVRSLLGNAAA